MTNSSRIWPRMCLRAVALANILVTAIGIYHISVANRVFPLWVQSTASSRVSGDFPDQRIIFEVMTTANVLFLGAYVLSSFYVWRSRAIGRTMGNIAYIAVIGYWLAVYSVKFFLLESGGERAQLIRNSISAVNALGNSGLSVQFDTWYPLIACILLNVAYHHLLPSSYNSGRT